MRDEKFKLLQEALPNGEGGININKIIDALYDIEEFHKKLELNDEFNAAIDKIATKVTQLDVEEEKGQLTTRLNDDIQKYKTNKGKVYLINRIANRSNITLDDPHAIMAANDRGEEEEESEEEEEGDSARTASKTKWWTPTRHQIKSSSPTRSPRSPR